MAHSYTILHAYNALQRKWIADAIERAVTLFKDVDLEVFVVAYGSVDKEVALMVEKLVVDPSSGGGVLR